MSDIKPIEYDADMDRFYIPVNSRYEIQTKGKGSSFRIANTETHERHLVNCGYVQAMLEDMAKGTHAELSQAQAEITRLNEVVKQNEIDAKRYRWLRYGDNDELVIQHGPVAPDYHWLPRNERLDAMIDNAMTK